MPIALNDTPNALNDGLPSRRKAKRFSPYACCAATVLCKGGGSNMRAAGTYFEQVPKTVVENILAQQAPRAENEMGSDAVVAKRAASGVPIQAKTRNSKPELAAAGNPLAIAWRDLRRKMELAMHLATT